MAVPHYLNLYQKPKVGDAFIRRYRVSNYRHKISAIGWFDTMSCDIAVGSRVQAQQFLEQYLGNRIAVYVQNPVEPIWEGVINRLTFGAGGASYTVSLDEMVNRVSTMYSATATSTTGTRNTPGNNTTSQAIYGIKEGTIDMGPYSGAGTTKPDTLRDTVLAMQAWPQASIRPESGDYTIHVECVGFWYTLGWENRHNAAGTNRNFDAAIKTDYLPGLANGATFFDNTDMTDIAAVAKTQAGNVSSGQTYLDLIRGIAEAGDATQAWVAGVGPIRYDTGKRRLYYRAANTAIEYTANMRDGLIIRNLYGRRMPPWDVRPDRGIQVNDWNIAGSPVGDDPTQTYIASIDYDAESQSVTYTGADNITVEGAFQLATSYRRFGRPFGAPTRNSP